MSDSYTFSSPPTRSLERHAHRRADGVPTVSVLIGPPAAGRRSWQSAVPDSLMAGSSTVFPWEQWIVAAVGRQDWPAIAVHSLAGRAGREPTAFLSEWSNKTAADRDRFWNLLAPQPGDDLLRLLAYGASLPLAPHGERAVAVLIALADEAPSWPGVLFSSGSSDDLVNVANTVVAAAIRFPVVPIAIAVSADVWAEFLTVSPDSRAKTILREGEWPIPILDTATVEGSLSDAGLVQPSNVAELLAANGADAALVEAAVGVVRATTPPPQSESGDDGARSAAERFLFEFLESIPETAGRFTLNEKLDFRFGNRAAEIDLLCRDPKIALEVDGYFHFLEPARYRRDRLKDFELQRRGYLVLRFLAEDVIPQLEMIRDRILVALNPTPHGEQP